MRRFNVNELIWFILLLFLTTLWGYLLRSGNIYDLVSPRMIKYSYFAFIAFIILTIFQITKIFTFPTRIDMSFKFIPLIFTLFMAVAYVSLNSTYTSSSSILLNEDAVLFNYTGNYISIGSNSDSNYEIIKNLNKDSEYIGKVISIVGYINPSNDKNKNKPNAIQLDTENIVPPNKNNAINNLSNTFLISRDEISCCLQDLSTVSVLCKDSQITKTKNNTVAINLANGSWVKAIGTLKYENGTIYLDLFEINAINEPVKKYYTHGA